MYNQRNVTTFGVENCCSIIKTCKFSVYILWIILFIINFHARTFDWIMQDTVSCFTIYRQKYLNFINGLLFGILITTETYLCDFIKNDVIFDKWAGTINVQGPPK